MFLFLLTLTLAHLFTWHFLNNANVWCFFAEWTAWHRQQYNHKSPASQLETEPNLMVGLRFSWFTPRQKVCSLGNHYNWLNWMGILNKYVTFPFTTCFSQTWLDKTGEANIEKGWTWRISSWQIGFCLVAWHSKHDAGNCSASCMNELPQSATARSPHPYNVIFPYFMSCGSKQRLLFIVTISRVLQFLQQAMAPFPLSLRSPSFV